MVFNTSTALFVLHALTQNQRAIPYPHKGLCQGVQEASPRWRRRGRRLVVRRVGRLATPHRGRDCSMAACFPFCRWGPHSSRTHVGDAERPVHHPWIPQGLKTRSSLRFSRLEKNFAVMLKHLILESFYQATCSKMRTLFKLPSSKIVSTSLQLNRPLICLHLHLRSLPTHTIRCWACCQEDFMRSHLRPPCRAHQMVWRAHETSTSQSTGCLLQSQGPSRPPQTIQHVPLHHLCSDPTCRHRNRV